MAAVVRAFVVGVAIQCVLIHHVATLRFTITADQVFQMLLFRYVLSLLMRLITTSILIKNNCKFQTKNS